MDTKKLMIVTNIPNQYRIPLFNALQKQLTEIGVDLLVVFGAQSLHSRRSIVNLDHLGFRYHLLSSSNSAGKLIFYTGLSRLILKEKPDALIVGGFSIPAIKATFLKLVIPFQFIIWTGSFESNRNSIPTIKKVLRKWLFKKADHWLAYSNSTKKYLLNYGVSEQKVKVIGNTVDTHFFSEETSKERDKVIQTDRKVLTYIGYLTPRKDVAKILETAKALLEMRSDFFLQIIGDGPEKSRLEQLVKTYGLSDNVSFEGFKQKEELPFYLAKTDAFLFQTSFDIWGLVLNEAMAASVLCFSSKFAGATQDLIKDGVNGYVVNFENANETARKIHAALEDEEMQNSMAQKGAETIKEEYTLENCAKKMISILQ